MDTLLNIIETIYNSPHYSFGWLVASCLAIIPAIVSVNLIQHYLSKVSKSDIKAAVIGKQLLINLFILLVCLGIFAYTFYIYVWIKP